MLGVLDMPLQGDCRCHKCTKNRSDEHSLLMLFHAEVSAEGFPAGRGLWVGVGAHREGDNNTDKALKTQENLTRPLWLRYLAGLPTLRSLVRSSRDLYQGLTQLTSQLRQSLEIRNYDDV